MSDLKITRPDFPHFEVYRKIVETVLKYTDNTLDLSGICITLGCFAARFAQVQRGRTLTREEWEQWCGYAYDNSRDEEARSLFVR